MALTHRSLLLIEDAAHAIEATYRGRRIGAGTAAAAFSFYATKNLTTGEGGMIATSNKRLADKIKLLSLHGMSKGAWKRYSKGGSWRYDLLDLGYKYNMPDLAASLGLAQFAKFEKLQALRHRAAARFMDNLSHLDELKLPTVQKESVHDSTP